MNAQAEEATASVGDVVKQVLSVFLVVAGVAAFYYFSDAGLLYRVIGIIVDIAVALSIAATTSVGRSVWSFILESKQEVKRVVWPTREETVRTTLMVVLMVFMVGVLLWFLDMFLFWGVRLLTGQGE